MYLPFPPNPVPSIRRQVLRLALLAWGLLTWGLGYTVHHAAGFKAASGKLPQWSVDDAVHTVTLPSRLLIGDPAPGWRQDRASLPAPAGLGSPGKLPLGDAALNPPLDPDLEVPEFAMLPADPAYRFESPRGQPAAPPVAAALAPPQRLLRPPNLA